MHCHDSSTCPLAGREFRLAHYSRFFSPGTLTLAMVACSLPDHVALPLGSFLHLPTFLLYLLVPPLSGFTSPNSFLPGSNCRLLALQPQTHLFLPVSDCRLLLSIASNKLSYSHGVTADYFPAAAMARHNLSGDENETPSIFCRHFCRTINVSLCILLFKCLFVDVSISD